MDAESDAPSTPETTAKVVTVPSRPANTKSDMYVPLDDPVYIFSDMLYTNLFGYERLNNRFYMAFSGGRIIRIGIRIMLLYNN
jgi:hypothetical protein